jgi:hypothetical protein
MLIIQWAVIVSCSFWQGTLWLSSIDLWAVHHVPCQSVKLQNYISYTESASFVKLCYCTWWQNRSELWKTLRSFSQNGTMRNVHYICVWTILVTVSIVKNNTFTNCEVVKGRVTKNQNEKHVLEQVNRQTSREGRADSFNFGYCVRKFALKPIVYTNL